MIRIERLEKSFSKTETLFSNVSVSFERGRSYGLSGTSGAGKSTLLHILAGLEKPSEGHVFFDDRDIHSLSEQERTTFLCNFVGIMFQVPHMIYELTVAENVGLKGIITGMSYYNMIERARELLQISGLRACADESPRSLSGGEQQRVALLRALFMRPLFLLADEPTAHLDKKNSMLILGLIQDFQRLYGMGVILCSHDVETLKQVDHIFELSGGTVWQQS